MAEYLPKMKSLKQTFNLIEQNGKLIAESTWRGWIRRGKAIEEEVAQDPSLKLNTDEQKLYDLWQTIRRTTAQAVKINLEMHDRLKDNPKNISAIHQELRWLDSESYASTEQPKIEINNNLAVSGSLLDTIREVRRTILKSEDIEAHQALGGLIETSKKEGE